MKEALRRVNSEKKTYQFAINYAESHPDKNYVFSPQNLGDSINTSDLEYFPSLTIEIFKMPD